MTLISAIAVALKDQLKQKKKEKESKEKIEQKRRSYCF